MTDLNFVTYDMLVKQLPYLPRTRAGRLNLINHRGFPGPRYINGNRPVWLASEVLAWVDARPRNHREAVNEVLGV